MGVCESVAELLVLGPQFADPLVSQGQALAERIIGGPCRAAADGLGVRVLVLELLDPLVQLGLGVDPRPRDRSPLCDMADGDRLPSIGQLGECPVCALQCLFVPVACVFDQMGVVSWHGIRRCRCRFGRCRSSRR